MMFNSRGFKTVAADKGAELEKALVKASEGGKYPIVCDTSPCLATIKDQLQDGSLKCAPAPSSVPACAAHSPSTCALATPAASCNSISAALLPGGLAPHALAPLAGMARESCLGSRAGLACRFALYEPIEFISTFLKDKLEWKKVKDTVAIHVPCSSKKMGIENAFQSVAGMCAHEVVPSGIPCCGAPL